MQFCQSCGMPLTGEVLGTEKGGGKSGDYCSYCYRDGAFTSECSMEEMIDFCVGPMVQHNPGLSEADAKARMMQFFPQLKRWKQ